MHLVKKKFRKLAAMALTLCLLVSGYAGLVGAADKPLDLQGHWADTIMTQWQQKGWIEGYEDGSVKPDAPVSRAELVSLANRSFAIPQSPVQANITDLDASDWAYAPFTQAIQAGYIEGYEDGGVRAHQLVTRQELTVILIKLAKLQALTASVHTGFTDETAIADWSLSAVATLSGKGVLNGYEDGTFRPSLPVTRAEAVVALQRTLGLKAKAFDQAGSFGPEQGTESIAGDAVIRAAGVTLKNMTIEGNLLIDEAVGEGDVFLNNVTVKGTITVKGGGGNSIHLTDTVVVSITVDKRTGTVRIVATGQTSVGTVSVQSSATIEESGITGSGFGDLVLNGSLPADSKVTLIGSFQSVDIAAAKVQIDLPKGSIEKLTIGDQAAGNKIQVGQGATIVEAILNAVVEVLGKGKIEKAVVQEGAKNSSFETKPESTSGPGANTAPPFFGGGFPSGGGSTTLPKTAVPTVAGPVYVNSTTISGQAESGAEIQVKRGGDSFASATANGLGLFTVTLPGTVTLAVGDTLLITAQKNGKTVSDSLSILVQSVPYSAKMIGAKLVELTFDQPLLGAATASFSVITTSGASLPVENVAVEPSNQKVTLRFAFTLPAGQYEVAVADQLQPIKMALNVDKETAQIQFPLSTAIYENIRMVYSKFQILNQYNEDVTGQRADEYSWSIGLLGQTEVDPWNGIVRIIGNYDLHVGQIFSISALSLDTGNFEFTNLKVDVTEKPALPKPPQPEPSQAVQIKGLFHSQGKMLREDSVAGEYKLLVSAQDQNGNEMDAAAMNQYLIAVNDGTTGVFETIQVNGQNQPALTLTGPLYKGKHSMTIYNYLTQATDNYEFEVNERAKVDQIKIADQTRVLSGVPNELAFEARDQYGDVVTNKTMLLETTLKASKGTVAFEDNGTGGLKIVYNGAATQNEYVYVYIMNATNQLQSVTLILMPDGNSDGHVTVDGDLIVSTLTLLNPDWPIAGEVIDIPFSASDQLGDRATMDLLSKVRLYTNFSAPVYFTTDYVTNLPVLKVNLRGTSVQYPDQLTGTFIYAELPNGTVMQRAIRILPRSQPVVLTATPGLSNVIAVGTAQTLTKSSFTALDQYGRTKSLADYADADFLPVSISIPDKANSTVSFNTYNLEYGSSVMTATSIGTTELQFKIKGRTNSNLSAKVQVVGAADIKGYEVLPLPKIYANDDPSYARTTVQVKGVLANGTMVKLPIGDDRYYTVTVTGSTYFNYAAGKLTAGSGVFAPGAINQDATFHVTVTGNVYGNPTAISQDVVVSNRPSVAETAELRDSIQLKQVVNGVFTVPYGIDMGAEHAAYLADKAIKVVDQYAREIIGSSKFSNVMVASLPPNKTIPELKPGESCSIVAMLSNGKVYAFKVVII